MKITTLFLFSLALTTYAPAQTKKITIAELYKKVSPAVVQVLGAGGIKGVPSRGAGVLVSRQGHLITFDSIALQPGSTSVGLANGCQVKAKIIARDSRRGLALLKIETKLKLKPATLPPPDTKPGPGIPILLTGYPFKVAGPGEKASAFFGLVTARLRLDLRLKRASFPLRHEVLLTGAPVNPGTQGGGLFDLQGRLIGIAGRLVESTETNTLVSYSIPIDEVRPFLDQVLSGKKKKPVQPDKNRPVTLKDLGLKLFQFGLRSSPPAYIHQVEPNSPAARAGLKADDLILELGKHSVRTCSECKMVLKRLRVNKKLLVIFKRGRTVQRTEILLKERK